MPTAEGVLAHAYAQQVPQTLQGTTRMRIQTPGRNARFRGVVLAQAPQQMRAEVLSVLGQPVAYLVVDPQALSLYSPYSDTYVTTEDPAGVFQRVAGSSVTGADLVGLLLGQVPPCIPREKGPIPVRAEALTIQCVEGGEVARTLVFDAETWLLRSVTGRSTSSGTFQVLLEDHQLLGDYVLPYHVQFTAPALGLDAELSWEDVAADQPVDPGLFVLAVPPGLTTHTFEELLDKREAASPEPGSPQ